MDIKQKLWIPKVVHFNTKVVENVRNVKVCGQLSWTKGKAEMKNIKSLCVSLPSLKEERERLKIKCAYLPWSRQSNAQAIRNVHDHLNMMKYMSYNYRVMEIHPSTICKL